MTTRGLSLSGAVALSVGVAIGCGTPGGPGGQTATGPAPVPVFAAAVRPGTIQLVADPSPLPAISMQDLDGRTITTDDLGNSGSGSGSLELAGSLLGLREGVVPATLNHETPDPQCPLNVVHGKPLEIANKVVMNINVTRMGQASVSIVEGA